MGLGIRSLTVLVLILYCLSWFALAFRGWRLGLDAASTLLAFGP
jgi:hypothetical protein